MTFSMLPALQFEDPEPPNSHNGSCTYLKKTNISHFDVAMHLPCKKMLPYLNEKYLSRTDKCKILCETLLLLDPQIVMLET